MTAIQAGSVPVERTIYKPMDEVSWRSMSKSRLMKLFDDAPLQDVREECIKRITRGHLWEDDIGWLEERIHAYISVPHSHGHYPYTFTDFKTVYMLLRGLTHASKEHKGKIFELIMDVLDKAVESNYSTHDLKDGVILFCGHLNHNPESYNARASTLMERMLGRGCGSDDDCRIAMRLIRMAGKVQDISLLPRIRQLILPPTNAQYKRGGLDSKFRYLSSSGHALDVDAAARQVVAYLEHLEQNLEE